MEKQGLKSKILGFIDADAKSDNINGAYTGFWEKHFFEYDGRKRAENGIKKKMQISSREHQWLPYGIFKNYHELDFKSFSQSVLTLATKDKNVHEIISIFNSIPNSEDARYYYAKKQLRIGFYESLRDPNTTLFDIETYNRVANTMVSMMARVKQIVSVILAKNPIMCNYDAVGFCSNDATAQIIRERIRTEIPYPMREKPWHRIVRFMNVIKQDFEYPDYVFKYTRLQGAESIKMAITHYIDQMDYEGKSYAEGAKKLIKEAPVTDRTKKRWLNCIDEMQLPIDVRIDLMNQKKEKRKSYGHK